MTGTAPQRPKADLDQAIEELERSRPDRAQKAADNARRFAPVPQTEGEEA